MGCHFVDKKGIIFSSKKSVKIFGENAGHQLFATFKLG
jgi:hypothetical protein